MRDAPRKHGWSWSEKDDRMLMRRIHEGCSMQSIALQLERTVRSCEMRVKDLGHEMPNPERDKQLEFDLNQPIKETKYFIAGIDVEQLKADKNLAFKTLLQLQEHIDFVRQLEDVSSKFLETRDKELRGAVTELTALLDAE